jgi:hypothetical protein
MMDFCDLCGFASDFAHDHKPDNSGIDDGRDLPQRKRPVPKRREATAAIRAQAWATRRAKYGAHGHR